MASQTTNLNLTKPALTDQFDLNVMNSNWDKIDAGYGALETARANSVKSKILNDGLAKTSRTYSIVGNARLMFACMSTTTPRCFLVMIMTQSDGTIRLLEINKGAQVDFDITNKGKLIVNWSAAAYCFGFVLASGQASADGISQDPDNQDD